MPLHKADRDSAEAGRLSGEAGRPSAAAQADLATGQPSGENARKPIAVEVCYAPPLPGALSLIAVEVEAGATVADAIRTSGVLARHPEIDLASNKVGIFGKLTSLDGAVSAQDRIEIYRPLTADPKVARQLRVEKIRASSTEGRKWQAREKR